MVALVTFVAGLVCVPVAGALARRSGVLDRPGPLKVQRTPVPYFGGLGVVAAATPAVVVHRPAYLLPVLAALALGLADDVQPVSPWLRLGAQIIIGGLTAAVVDTGAPAAAEVAVVMVVVVVAMNAVNLLDGLDGLAGGVTFAGLAGLAVLLGGTDGAVAAGFAGAVAAFLVFNRPPARIYLGDAGAYSLGAVLAVLVVAGWSPDQPAAVGLAGLLALAIPVADTAVAVVRRRRAGRPLFEGDRGHVYDQLVDRGWSPLYAVGALVVAQAALSAVAVAVGTAAGAAAAAAVATVVVVIGVGAIVSGFVSPGYRRELQ